MTERLTQLFDSYKGKLGDPYEVVRTVGFRMRSENNEGNIVDFDSRLEIVSYASGGYGFLFWTFDAKLFSWVPLAPLTAPPNVMGPDPDEVLESLLTRIFDKALPLERSDSGETPP